VLAPLWIWRRPGISGPPLLGIGALALLPAFSAAVDLRAVHPGLLLALLVTVWISDTAAYFTGRRFGRRRLAPSISPGKTWEGVGGALAAVALYALVWTNLTGPVGTPHWPGGTPMARPWIVPLLLGLSVVGMIGDLIESLIKRQAGVKDSGTLLPGHGGILDRIDAPVAMLPLAMLAFMR
ncbi:MAG: phosphatidate cytidylyltransferase, partial [Burkholderiales bacterium]